MTQPAKMNIERKLIVRMVAILVVLPILYVASSGPVLLLASKRQDQGLTYGRVFHFYRPELRAALALHLWSPLFWYLRLWNLHPVLIKVAGKTGTPKPAYDWLGPYPIVAPPKQSPVPPRVTPTFETISTHP
jgi:hypothetical protein